MKAQFDVWEYNFPVKGPHPVVLISPPDRAGRAKHVNVLFCTSQRQSRQPYPFEVMLDTEDGLSWETFCDCSILYAIASDQLVRKCGRVVLTRRNAIREKLRDVFRLAARD
jgi:mRNA-degrading endonuclease toxin of MazEF toxin-antitoxin module